MSNLPATTTPLALLVKALDRRIRWWREEAEDPHQIGNAVLAALEEVRACLVEASPKGLIEEHPAPAPGPMKKLEGYNEFF